MRMSDGAYRTYVSTYVYFLIDGGLYLVEGGLYSETAMRKAKSENTVYSRHQGLKRASHLTKYTREQHLAGAGSMCLLFCLKQTRWGAGPGPQDREWCVLTWRIGVCLGERPTSLDGR